jgi:hypothetical protein
MEADMEVLDIVQSAAFKAGIISSFNHDEIPGDIVDAGRNVLASEILPSINCDRTLDITVTSRVYTPAGNRIVLAPFKPKENWRVIGYSQYTSDELTSDASKWAAETQRLFLHLTWPTNDLGDATTLAMWTTDMVLVAGTSDTGCTKYPEYNIDFPPMRVSAVVEATSHFEYLYLYREEFERTVVNTVPGIYTVEEYEDKLIVLFKGPQTPKILVLPVPLQIVNSDHACAGEIIAPPKFKRYLIDCVAVSLAIIYGVSSLPAMEKQQAVSYNLLKKNKPQPLHEANTAETIADTIRYGRRTYGSFRV